MRNQAVLVTIRKTGDHEKKPVTMIPFAWAATGFTAAGCERTSKLRLDKTQVRSDGCNVTNFYRQFLSNSGGWPK
jgi:hypothetical protein